MATDPHTPLPYLYIGTQATWQMPELSSLCKLQGRATCWPFPTPAEAYARVPEASRSVQLLSGNWEFQLFDRPGDVTPAALAARTWRHLAVPGNWTMQLRNEAGCGEAFYRPHYTNIQMPFAEHFPHLPPQIATGVYRTRVSVPHSWAGQRVVLHFAGCEGALFVYLDGIFVGMNKDSRTAAEYDLSALVRPGEHCELLCVNPRYSDASFVEDQDHWWQAGIHRDVYVYATPQTYLEDVYVHAELAIEAPSATLHVRVHTRTSTGATPAGRLHLQLYDPAGAAVFSAPLVGDVSGPPLGSGGSKIQPTDTAQATFRLPVEHPQLWSAEVPALYTLTVTLEAGDQTMSTAVRTGLRSVEIRNRTLRVNGQPVMIHGMNRHDHSDTHGKAVSKALMRLDAQTMKAHNVNAVRTSHYPNDPYWLDLCDEYGFYVVDEANIETHALLHLSEDARVAAAFAERVRNMVERDKNHPSVIIWSLGNESGYGPNHDTAAAWVRAVDPTRPIQYEGAIGSLYNDLSFVGATKRWGSGQAATDILNPMYCPLDDLVAWVTSSADPRPLIMCEYAHAMGNSSGSLADYYALFEQYHGLQGGFIWEWVDHGIAMVTPEGEPYWAYGGSFGEVPHDGVFIADGMVWPDRTPHPGMHEFKYLARPVRVTAIDVQQGWFQLENRRYFTDLRDLDGEWRLLVDGSVTQRGVLTDLDIAPQARRDLHIALEWPAQGESFIEFRFSTARATAWAPAGYLMAWDQLPGVARMLPALPVPAGAMADLQIHDGQIILSVADHRAVIDQATGEVTAFGLAGLLQRGPQLNLWRAPTSNDILQAASGSVDRAWPLWERLGMHQLQYRLEALSIKADAAGAPAVEVVVAATGREQWDDVHATHTYTLLADGTLRITTHLVLSPEYGDLPRVGLNLQLTAEFDQLSWYGRGPWENYSDRKAGSLIGCYSSTVGEQYVPYIFPQEHGHKTDVRWLRLTNAQGQGLEVWADGLFQWNALHHTSADLTAAVYPWQLPTRSEVDLSLDYAMRGLGTGLVVDTLPQYRLQASEYHFTFYLRTLPLV